METKKPRPGKQPKRRLSFTLCPKDQPVNKRIKVTEPNVSVPGYRQGWSCNHG